jgi:hypothetical protein
MKTRPAGAELFHTDGKELQIGGRTDGWTHVAKIIMRKRPLKCVCSPVSMADYLTYYRKK